jgi:uncharacterized protein (TIGR00255 family)
MLKSMTGYGRAQAIVSDIEVTVEIKSVNHRFLDIMVKLPKKYSLLEDNIKSSVQKFVDRGRIEVWFDIQEKYCSGPQVKVDKDLAIYYHESLKELAFMVGIPYALSIYELSGMGGVVTLEEPETNLEKVWQAVYCVLNEALEQLVAMREKEGACLSADLKARKNLIGKLIQEIEERNPEIVQAYKSKLYQRVRDLTAGIVEINEDRLATEVALFAEKSDITEEIVRLKSHLDQITESLATQAPVGRKLDFILQEVNREINTISSKSPDVLVSQKVVEVKSEIEKMREQVQNVE